MTTGASDVALSPGYKAIDLRISIDSLSQLRMMPAGTSADQSDFGRFVGIARTSVDERLLQAIAKGPYEYEPAYEAGKSKWQ